MIEPKPTAVAVGIFCLLIAMKRAGLHQTGAKALVRRENERPRKELPAVKRAAEALSHALWERVRRRRKTKSPHPQTRAGERGDAVLER